MLSSIMYFFRRCERRIDLENIKYLKKSATDWGSSYIQIGYRKAMERGKDILHIALEEWKKEEKLKEEAIYKSTYESYIAKLIIYIEYELQESNKKIVNDPKMATYYTGYTSGLKFLQESIILYSTGRFKKRVKEAVESGNYQMLLEEIER